MRIDHVHRRPPLVRSAAPAISPDEAIREVEENLLKRRRIIRQRIATEPRLFAIGRDCTGADRGDRLRV
jgi:hypothetical protein